MRSLGISRHLNRSQQGLEDSQPTTTGEQQINLDPRFRYNASASSDDIESTASSLGPEVYADSIRPYTTGVNQGQGTASSYRNAASASASASASPSSASAALRSSSQRHSGGHIAHYSTGNPQDYLQEDTNFPEPTERERSQSVVNINISSRLSQPTPALPAEQKKRRFPNLFSKSKDKADASSAPGASHEHSLSGVLGRRQSKSHNRNSFPHSRHSEQEPQPQLPVLSSPQSSYDYKVYLPTTGQGEGGPSVYDPSTGQSTQSSHNQQSQDPRHSSPFRLVRSNTDTSFYIAGPSSTQRESSAPDLQLAQPQQQQHSQRLSQNQALYQQQQYADLRSQNQSRGEARRLSSDSTQQDGKQLQPTAAVDYLHPLLNTRFVQNPEVVSQLSQEQDSPVDGGQVQYLAPPFTSETGSVSALPSPAPQDHPASSYSFTNPGQQTTMANNANRRSADVKSALDAASRGPPPAYSQQLDSVQTQQTPNNTLPQALQPATRPPVASGEQARTAPQNDERQPDAIELEKLSTKYKKVKGLYFEKVAQVEQLQNTLANQRLSSSRTSLDDSEYGTRFSRLDGAIKEMAFSFRKDWKKIPHWLRTCVNSDAMQVGTKEMTAVGRAAISRWLFEEIFCKCFHPGLDPGISAELKRLELNIRRHSSKPTNAEEETSLSAKIVQWKLATMDGLSDDLVSPESEEHRSVYTVMAVGNLTDYLAIHLSDATSTSAIEGSAISIVELAVGICMHLAKESRDIVITFPIPRTAVNPAIMKVETSITALGNSIADDASDDSDSSEDDKGSAKKTDKIVLAASAAKKAEKDQDEGKVRFAGFMSVEVKGKHSLITAPIWVF